MNKHIKKYLVKNLKDCIKHITSPYQANRLINIMEILDVQPVFKGNTIATSIHNSNKAEYFENIDGSITVKPTNPNRKVDDECSLVRISNDVDGWNYFNTEIRPFVKKGTKFRYLYRCPKNGKPYPKNFGNVKKHIGKIVSIYIS